MQSAVRSKVKARCPTSRQRQTGAGRTASRRPSIATATPSSACSVASRTSAASPLATTGWPTTSSLLYALPPPSATGYESGPVGDAAFVARPHVATGVMKAAIDAESLADALAAKPGDVAAALQHYDKERQPYGAALVTRGRHIGAYFADRGSNREQRIETLMREYGAAGLVHEQPI